METPTRYIFTDDDSEYVKADAYAALELKLAEALSELKDCEESNEAMDAKIKSLAPHGSCGCSYDTPGDLCMHHSPKLTAAIADAKDMRLLLCQMNTALTDLIRSHYSKDLTSFPKYYRDLLDRYTTLRKNQ